MRIGLRLLLGFFLVLGLALFVVLRIFLEEVKPGTRLAMEDSLVDTAYALAQLATPEMVAGTLPNGQFAQAMLAYNAVRPEANIWGFRKEQVDNRVTIVNAQGIVVFDSRQQALGQDHSRWNDVVRTLRGEYGARSSAVSPDDPDNTVMHVAAPIRDGSRIIGALTVSRANQSLEPYIVRSQQRILRWSWGLLGGALLLGLVFSWWMASSLSRLQRYAQAVARGERVSLPAMGRLSGNTEFSDLARALERMREKLEDKAYVENYVHTLTHELKSPLAAMRGAAELLQEPMAEADRQRFAGNIERQTLRLQALVDKLLNLAEVEQMRQLSNSEPVDLVALTEEAMQALEPRWRLKGLQFSCDLGNEPIRVRGDRFLLAQAMRNLIDNAIDFSPQGGHITCTLTRDTGGWVIWSLRDEGTGVPDYALDRVFERFYSLPRSDTQEKSSGLGLCLVKEVSDLHGAQVRVDNVDHPRGCLATWRFPA